jgi:ParB-like chromosome segregation protein Spo0J
VIANDLLGLVVPTGELRPMPGNPRRGDVEAIARSLQAFGQRKPVVALRDGTVIAGNHTLLAALHLGWSELAVVRVDDDETTATAFALADNRTAELGDFDALALAALIQQVQQADEALLSAISYSDVDLQELLNSPAAQGVGDLAPPDEFTSYDDDLDTAYRCPACGYEWSGMAR